LRGGRAERRRVGHKPQRRRRRLIPTQISDSSLSLSSYHVLQVRQHVEHKRTFMMLEQLILKHGADANCLQIRGKHEGLDFFYSNR
jgi:hypothetical protein